MPNVMAALPNIGGALCSMPQFGWRRLLECRAVTLPRRETCWNLLGCPKLPNWSQLLRGPKVTIFWGHVEEVLLFNKFFSDCQCVPSLRRYNPTKLCDAVQRNFWQFLRPVFSASRVRHVSSLHPKFALRPHHVWKYGRHPICNGWD